MNEPFRILYVDDYPLDRLLVRDALEREHSGFHITEATSREEFEARLAENGYDLVLSDFNILGFDGLEVIEAVRAQHPDLPVVIVTGTGSEEIAVEAMKRGAADYVIKTPSHIRRLPHSIEAVIHQQRLADQHQRTQDALRESEERLRSFMDASTQSFTVWDSELNLVTINKAALRFFPAETREEDLLGKNMLEITPGVKESGRYDRYLQVIESGEPLLMDDVVPHPMFGEVNLSVRVFKVGAGLGMVIADLTERVRAEDQLKAALREKEVLLKEVHHRVKNNLQVIASLLSLQAGTIKDEKAQAAFQESQHRVRSMAAIHERLYQSPDLAHLEMEGYIRQLVADLWMTHAPPGIACRIDAAGVTLDMDTAVPCGLILNELVSNALTHAFPPELETKSRPGQEPALKKEIRITMRSEQDAIVLTVSDNGIGLPADLDLDNLDSLGLELVRLLTRQIGGVLLLDKSLGTSFQITFPAP